MSMGNVIFLENINEVIYVQRRTRVFVQLERKNKNG